MGVQALADMSDVERKLALERYKLLEPHLQNGRELRSVSKGSEVSFRTLQRWVAGLQA
jgi:putative transposase